MEKRTTKREMRVWLQRWPTVNMHYFYFWVHLSLNYNFPIFRTIGSDDRIVVTLFVPGCDEINSLEHVVANISFSYSTRGDLKLTLVSPQGTPSEILSYRKNDFNPNGIFYFPFMTVYNWGESPVGEWQLIIESRSTNGKDNKGALEHFSLTFSVLNSLRIVTIK